MKTSQTAGATPSSPPSGTMRSGAAEMDHDMAVFRGVGLGCRRGGRQVFRDLDFSLAPGGALLLTGANGSGKSSLLRQMAGLLPVATGGLYWGETPLDRDPEDHRRRLCYVGHQAGMKPSLSVGENLLFWARLAGHSGGGEAALAAMGLEKFAALPARLLSAGQMHRLSLARLFVAARSLWLLDEPTVGLDDRSVERLHQAIAGHRAAGGRVVAASHGGLDLAGAVSLSLGSAASRSVFGGEA